MHRNCTVVHLWISINRKRTRLLHRIHIACQASRSSAGVGPLWSLWRTFWIQNSRQPGHFRGHRASLCWQTLYREADFILQQELGSCLIFLLTIPHRSSMGYCQEEDDRQQTKQCKWPEGFPYPWAVATGWSPPWHDHQIIKKLRI